MHRNLAIRVQKVCKNNNISCTRFTDFTLICKIFRENELVSLQFSIYKSNPLNNFNLHINSGFNLENNFDFPEKIP